MPDTVQEQTPLTEEEQAELDEADQAVSQALDTLKGLEDLPGDPNDPDDDPDDDGDPDDPDDDDNDDDDLFGESPEPEDEPEPEEITDELLEEMNQAYNYWHTHGYPERASVIWECLQQRRRPPANLLPGSKSGIHPETAIDPDQVTIPPRSGPKATREVWRAFAKKVIDMEPELIDALERKDLISILEDKGVIEKVESPSD